MATKPPDNKFLGRIGRIFNSSQTRTVALTGNIFDVVYLPEKDKYVPLTDFLTSKWGAPEFKGYAVLVYELNGPICFVNEGDRELIKKAWESFRTGMSEGEREIRKLINRAEEEEGEDSISNFETALATAVKNPAFALEFLRMLCQASRTAIEGKKLLEKNLIILIEGADLLIPEGEISRLNDADRKKVAICRDWFGDYGFVNGGDSVILITESRSKMNLEVSRLPQIIEVEIPSPNAEQRAHFIDWFSTSMKKQGKEIKLGMEVKDLVLMTAGLHIVVITQLLKEAAYSGEAVNIRSINDKISAFAKGQLGDDVIEFKRPSHTFDQVVGSRALKDFLLTIFVPLLKAGKISGATVGGPIGAGKTYIFEAVAAMLGIPVIVLKNLRSKWFGDTDIIFERLRRFLEALGMVLIFVDEADTQFGGVGKDVHETEKRLTGKIQAMMSDPALRGKVIWLLVTARIQNLSQDILREGRAGDMIFAILDPDEEDRKEFVKWAIASAVPNPTNAFLREAVSLMSEYSANNFSSFKGALEFEVQRAKESGKPFDREELVKTVIRYRIAPNNKDFRRKQALEALLRVTDSRLLPKEAQADPSKSRNDWEKELQPLRARFPD